MPYALPRLIALAAALALPAAAGAAGLQVEPVSVVIDGRSSVLWLSNTGDAPLQAQIRVYGWSQDGQGDTLQPTAALISSPPMATIAADRRQVVRLVAANPRSCEDSYRLAIDEVPPIVPKTTGLRYVMHYSLPVFVTARGCAKIRPDLHWDMQASAGGMIVTVANHGLMHAQLAQLRLVTAKGVRRDLAPGLLGYVLPGMARTFTFPVAPADLADGGTLELAVNGNSVTQPLALARSGR